MKSEAYPPLTSLSLSASSRLIYLFPSLSGLVSVFLRERKREKSTFSLSLSLSVEKREDIILLRTRHKVKYRRHKRRTRPWTSLVLRIGTNEEEKKKKENGREETQERRKEARGTGGGHLRDTPAGEVPTRKIDAPGNLPVVLCSLYYTRPSAKSLKRLPI